MNDQNNDQNNDETQARIKDGLAKLFGLSQAIARITPHSNPSLIAVAMAAGASAHHTALQIAIECGVVAVSPPSDPASIQGGALLLLIQSDDFFIRMLKIAQEASISGSLQTLPESTDFRAPGVQS